MKYYSYISNSKLDMLFPQIPKPFLEDISGELSVNFGLLKATLKDKGITSNRLSKLDAVVKYIERQHDVGDIAETKNYIRGEAQMYSTILDEGMVMFSWSGKSGAENIKNNLLLSGSSQHLIGMDHSDLSYPHSITNMVLKRLSGLRKTQSELEEKLICENGVCVLQGEQNYLKDIRQWATNRTGPPQKFEYLARTLINEVENRNRTILATPIYMAMVD